MWRGRDDDADVNRGKARNPIPPPRLLGLRASPAQKNKSKTHRGIRRGSKLCSRLTDPTMGWLDNWSKQERPEDKMRRETPGELVLKEASIKLSDPSSRRQQTYARILINEVVKRARCKWEVAAPGQGAKGKKAAASVPVIVLRVADVQATTSKEAYRVETDTSANLVTVTGASDRGLLYGVGRLLRLMNMDYQVSYSSKFQRVCSVPGGLIVISQPDYWMRQ